MFIVTFKQVSILLAFISLGYFLGKRSIVKREGANTLSRLLIYVCLPAYSLSNYLQTLTMEKISKYATIIGCGFAVVLIVVLLATVLSKAFSDNKIERNMYLYMFSFSNISYFGYPLIKAVFGAEILSYFQLFCLPICIFIYSFGYFILTATDTPDSIKVDKKAVLKRVFSFPFIASLVSIALALLPVNYPSVIFDFLDPAGNCMSALSMILVGLVLSQCSLKEVFSNTRSYVVGVVRLIVIPCILGALTYALYKLCDLDQTVLICVMAFACLPAGMNVVVYPESVGISGKKGAEACVISYLMSLATVPLWFYLLSVLL